MPHTLRVVVSWKGEIEPIPTIGISSPHFNVTEGTEVLTIDTVKFPIGVLNYGIKNYGFGETNNGTKFYSFDIETNNLNLTASGTVQNSDLSQYRFFVHNGTGAISSLSANNLQVEVYEPENSIQTFARPVATYKLGENTTPSNVSDAHDWYVFDVKLDTSLASVASSTNRADIILDSITNYSNP